VVPEDLCVRVSLRRTVLARVKVQLWFPVAAPHSRATFTWNNVRVAFIAEKCVVDTHQAVMAHPVGA